MFRWLRPFDRLRINRRKTTEIDPDEIFIDSANLAAFDKERFEGRIERPLPRAAYVAAGSFFALCAIVLLGRAGELQLIRGQALAAQARDNQVTETTVFADRGVIYDRAGRELSWNERPEPRDDF